MYVRRGRESACLCTVFVRISDSALSRVEAIVLVAAAILFPGGTVAHTRTQGAAFLHGVIATGTSDVCLYVNENGESHTPSC